MTQNEMILSHLKTGAPLTGLEALQLYGVFRLPSRVSDLKKMGHDIVSQMVERKGKFVAKYFIVPEDK